MKIFEGRKSAAMHAFGSAGRRTELVDNMLMFSEFIAFTVLVMIFAC